MEENNNRNLNEDMPNLSEGESKETSSDNSMKSVEDMPQESPSESQEPQGNLSSKAADNPDDGEKTVAEPSFPQSEESQTTLSPNKNEWQPAPAVQAYRWDYTEQSEYNKKMKKHSETRGIRNFAIIMSIAFLFAIGTLVGVLLLEPRTVGTSLTELYDECYPSYTAISVTSELGTSGVGSGIIMTRDGYIATNYHVVENAKNINVILYNGTSVQAKYIDGDELNDIAIIKAETTGLTPATIGTSATTRVGDQVMAIGTPYSAQYRGTMTSGYISALNRKYIARNENETVKKVMTLLQTDTSVNPGNSGGPLFNMDGEVIGIVSMKIAGSEYEGMGFAIPIDGVIDMLNDIIKNGKLTISNGGSAFEGAALGISGFSVEKDTKYLLTGDYHYKVTTTNDGEEVVNYVTSFGTIVPLPIDDEIVLAEYGIEDYTTFTSAATGVLIIGTTKGFDSEKKFRVNDIILSANGESCEVMETLQNIIANSRVGDKIKFEVFREGKTISVTVELGRSANMGN